MIGALEFGGSHLCVGAVDLTAGAAPGVVGFRRVDLDSRAAWCTLHDLVADAAAPFRGRVERWAAAMPGPFDYARGVGARHIAGKFRAFAGRDLGAGFADVLASADLTWLNDAHAFGVGRHAALAGPRRVLALTFGSGIGSAFIEDGVPLTGGVGVPAGGEVYALPHGAGTLEEAYGPAALVAQAGSAPDFRSLCDQARRDPDRRTWLTGRFAALADSLAPWFTAFGPDAVAVGGSACRSWDLVGPAFTERVRALLGRRVPFDVAVDTEQSALIGAAAYAARLRPTGRDQVSPGSQFAPCRGLGRTDRAPQE